MNNKETLQNNNNRLAKNNLDLASVLEAINNLPEAGSGGGTRPKRIYLIKDGVEQTDITGGSTFNHMNNDVGYSSATQGNGYLSLSVSEAYWSYTFNNTFDYKTYSRLRVDWAYPKTDSYGGYVQPTIAIKMAEKPSDSSPLRVFLLDNENENENTKERTVSELDVSTAEENIKVNIIVGHTGYGNDYTDYPAQIYNLYLEDPSASTQDANEVYSITEVKTNKTWIDDKPIYRKVFTGTLGTITNGTYGGITFDLSDLNFDNIVTFYGSVQEPNNAKIFWALHWHNITSKGGGMVYVSGNNLAVRVNVDWLSGAVARVVLEYTKTTD